MARRRSISTTPLLAELDYSLVAEHYEDRVETHKKLRRLFTAKQAAPYARLALGIDSPLGNYSAAEHALGPKVLSRARPARVLSLAQELISGGDPMSVPTVVRAADIWCLKISVGSEIAALLEPKRFWVTNTRTVWAHLLVKHNDNVERANAELQAYRDDEYDSEMLYAAWTDIHVKLDVALTRLAEASESHARKKRISIGELTYLWADAVANQLYELRDKL